MQSLCWLINKNALLGADICNLPIMSAPKTVLSH